ncbi:MAG TPA: hypothetical protein VER17_12570 [Tepidisphaeraceae bacterium]|nr:hypothetical protein [Tepidisphaeraceae bacterium]
MHVSSKVAALAVLAVCLAAAAPAQGQVGRRFPSEKKVVEDKKTGVPMTVLTSGQSSDAKIYQTHPQWTADGKWIIFRSSGRSEGSQAYAVNEATGDIVQLTEGPGNNTGSLNVARKSMKLYFMRNATAATQPAASRPAEQSAATQAAATQAGTGQAGTGQAAATQAGATTRRGQRDDSNDVHQVIELDLERLFADSEKNSAPSQARGSAVQPAKAYERICATLPPGLASAGGVALDADEQVIYMGARGLDVGKHLPPGTKVLDRPEGARLGAGPGALRAFDLRTGEMKVIIDTPFQVGHVQTNPWVPGEIIYCWETGGDAPQRMFTVRADGSGNRPLFEEEKLDWVTHEAVVTRDEVMFNLIGHQSRLRVRPTGIAVINLRSNAVQLIDQIEEREPDRNQLGANAAGSDSYGGYWHCNGSPDGRWAVGDTFGGNIWLIDRRDGKRTLWSSDHKMRPDHAHPTFDASSTKVLIQSGHFTDGQRLSLVVLPVPVEMLEKQPAEAKP